VVKRFTTQISPCLIVLGVFVGQTLVMFGALTPGDQIKFPWLLSEIPSMGQSTIIF